MCLECAESVRRGKLPKNSLANGLWIGEVPSVLTDLTFAEQTLISRVRINNFVLKLQSGMYKTKCNIIAFQNPVPQILESLPPPTSDLEEPLQLCLSKVSLQLKKISVEFPCIMSDGKRCKMHWSG